MARASIKIIAVIIGCVILSVGAVWLWNYKTNLPVPDTRTAQDFIAPLIEQEPQLFDAKDAPVFTITKIDHPEKNWYILTIKAKGDASGIESKLVMSDPYFSTDYIHVVAGPESSFSTLELTQNNVPDNIIQEVMKR